MLKLNPKNRQMYRSGILKRAKQFPLGSNVKMYRWRIIVQKI